MGAEKCHIVEAHLHGLAMGALKSLLNPVKISIFAEA